MKVQLSSELPVNLDSALHRLLRAWEHGSLPQSILLSGAAGVGKKRAALEIARILSCASQDLRPCGECFSCRVTAPKEKPTGENPYLWLLPMRASSERGKKEERQEKAESIAKQIVLDPYGDPYENGAGHIVGAVRDLLQKFQYHEERARVVLIPEAERMNESTANALLKTLEEAPEHTYFILTCSNKAQLLPTIISRCVQVQVQPLQYGDLAMKLREMRPEITEEECTLLYALSEGCLGKVLHWMHADLSAVRQKGLDFLAAVMTGRHEQLHSWLMASKIGSDQDQWTEFLKVLYVLVGDLVAFQSGVMPRNRDLVDELKALQKAVPSDKGLELLSLIQSALRRAQSNLPIMLSFHTMALEWDGVLSTH